MASSKNSSKAFSAALAAVLPFADFFYILQQEEYDSSRYLHWLPRFFFRRNIQERDRLKYTRRVTSSMAVAVLLWIGTGSAAMYLSSLIGIWAPPIIVGAWLFLIPLFVLVTNWLLTPYYNFVKRRVMRRAAKKVAENSEMKIVAIAGSFGKTTTKNFIYDLVRFNYAAQMVPGNINTPLGIGMWMLGSLQKHTQLLIVEVDAYKRGEIAASVEVVPPNIAIVTNVGDQHLARFGSKEKVAAALKEVFLGAKPGARLLCTSETAAAFGALGPGKDMNIVSDDKKLFEFLDEPVFARFSASNKINLAFAVRVAELLNIPRSFIIDTCGKLELPDRRQKITKWHGYTCVDDSYNISLTTALAGIEAASNLARRERKKLLVITAGIPEFGPGSKDDNVKLGSAIAKAADHAIVLKSMFADDIVKGLGDAKKYSLVKNLVFFAETSHGKFPPGDWIFLIQPELTDLYY